MSIKDTYKHLRELLSNITADLEKSENGNKAASQRVRTGTVKLEKIAKLFRKESISTEKKTKGQKRPSKAAGAKKGGAAKGKAKSRSATAKSRGAAVKAKPKAKSVLARTTVRSRPLSIKRATAKLPTRRMSAR
jgi:Histone H1-like protein Hc1